MTTPARLVTPATVTAWRQAIHARKPWERSTGPRTPDGKRQGMKNATLHGLESQAFRWAMRYIAAVGTALGGGVCGD